MAEFKQCCDPGTVWEGTPTGEEVTLGGLDTYLATPPLCQTPKGGVLVITDVFSWEAKNVRLFADRVAKAGYVAVCPDYFHGEVLTKERYTSKDFSISEWICRYPQEQVMSESESVLADLKTSHGIDNVGAIGFCWGGLYALKLNASSAVKAAVLNHCSLLAYNMEVLDQIAHPVLFQCSDNDSQIPTELRHKIEEKLHALPFNRSCLLKFYPGQEHGWTMRGDDKDASVQWAAEEAFEAALFFFNTHLKAASA
ncbi:hypothetical protein WJX84_008958 [Apatococcus fuscideae]|uniref:Dienelactone hydrolase domain-containing protein n=1 Tax=Apatococcus fuscideae TaxID=2026836 RepID=A0AAW1RSC9_9CHLO